MPVSDLYAAVLAYLIVQSEPKMLCLVLMLKVEFNVEKTFKCLNQSHCLSWRHLNVAISVNALMTGAPLCCNYED